MIDGNQTRRDVLRTIGALGLGGSALTAVGSATPGPKPTLVKRDAKKAARRLADHIGSKEEYSDWRAQGIRRPELFYAKVENGQTYDLKPRAWVFPVENRGDDVGYLTVDATRSEPLALAYGRDRAPQRRYEDAEAHANVRGLAAQRTFVYHGGVEYGVLSDEGPLVDLRGNRARKKGPVKSLASLSPDTTAERTARLEGDVKNAHDVSFGASGTSSGDDWDRSTDEEIYGVPNWTGEDGGDAASTDFGTGDDSWGGWNGWDGCVPIATSMAVAYHEGIYEWQDEDREELIDRLHVLQNTDSGGSTAPKDIDNVKYYSRRTHDYDATTYAQPTASAFHWSVDHDEPAVLAMDDTEYGGGHAVTVVGYDHVDKTGFDDHYYKVHNTYASSPDVIVHGDYDWPYLCQIWTE